MPVLITIALRNLREHKAKTLIIGIIVALGIAILVVGNSMMATAALGVRKSFIDNYTGHVMVSGRGQGNLSIFGYAFNTGNDRVPTIPRYEEVLRYISSQPEVAASTSQVTGFGIINLEENGNDFSMLFGIEPESYRAMFDSITILQGSYLEPGEEGMLISEKRIKDIKKEFGISLSAGDSIILNGLGQTGFKVREMPIKGVFRFNLKNEQLDVISFIDVQSLRYLNGMTVGTKAEIKLEEDETALLETSDMEGLFEEVVVEKGEGGKARLSEESLLNILGDTSGRERTSRVDAGAWHFILLKLKDGAYAPGLTARLNRWFGEQRIEAQAVDWKAAAGGFGRTADVIRIVFNVVILIVSVVAVIIIMNTLVVSVIERTSEIGTMRALGAQKSFVWRMFLLETLTISLAFGAIGIAAGALTIGILNLIGIPASNVFLQILFGGGVLHPTLSLSSVAYAFATVILIGILAHLYPVLIALRITPVRAIQTE